MKMTMQASQELRKAGRMLLILLVSSGIVVVSLVRLLLLLPIVLVELIAWLLSAAKEKLAGQASSDS
ncbi:hypothetical protein D3C73_983000 [compost metagenome]